MSRGLLAGMTDYSHQSFSDLKNDLEENKNLVIFYSNLVKKNVETLKKNSYWTNKVSNDFEIIISYSIIHFETTISEISDIVKDINIEVKQHHINRLLQIAKTSSEINRDIGKIWNNDYLHKEYGNQNFALVEEVYAKTRDIVATLLDLSNIANRLKDFLGKKTKNMKNNPWITGSFYTILAVIVITGLAVLSNSVHWSLLPIIIIGGILLIVIIGVLQLKNDDKISDKSFITLLIETFNSLPLIGKKHEK